ncbi:TonB-dependent receptor [Algibacter pacificus]|uniref:TonB-dependent receptor n=1 Tax=Algibacter pacificus TaxID=2599389 RepID=UPI0011CCC325|nr:carboxypeptidase regulatory-like domain-containing protein [Algibacter pacificus]
MKRITQNLLITILFVVSMCSFGQGVTTSSINGQVTDANGQPLPGANVIAVHTPSGTKYGAATNFDGFYRISNMRTGGPYKVSISFVGYGNFVDQNIYLQLGDSKRISVGLSEDSNALQEVVISAERDGVFDSGKNGTGNKVSNRQVTGLPSISRNIADFARLTPQARISGDDNVSIAGQNNRYNAIYIDGAVNNDVFGLSSSGTNGGQTGVSPISLDAIEAFQINVAPFDVRQSGFAGGSINAITKSGTNTFEGSAYTFMRNEDLAGKTPVGLVGSDGVREKLDDFSSNIYGARLGGAIVKDKLFFFVNYENEKRETPQPFNGENYIGDSSVSDIQGLSDFLVSNYGYNPGGYTNNVSSLNSDKLIAKIDWNINDNHKLSLKHSYVKATQVNASGSSARSINFLNGAINFESITNSTALELNSTFGQKFANNLVIGYTSVNDNRDPNGSAFPSVAITDGSGRINFGSEAFSTANLLEQNVLTVTDNFEIYTGAHTVTFGVNGEFTSALNVFFGRNYGYYNFDNLSDFLDNNRPIEYRIGYSLLGGSGDNSLGAAEFDYSQLGFYVQDEVDFTENFKLTAGLRFDIPYWNDGLVNDDFNTRTVGLLEAAGKDLQGARVGQGISSSVHVSPRIGFNWDVNGDKSTQIRGGLGIFTSRVPLVWPGGTYNNNGLTAGETRQRFFKGETPEFFNPDVNSQFKDPAPGSGTLGGKVDLFAKDFKLPQVFKTNIAIDQKLPYGFVFSADFVWNDNITAIAYENLNRVEPQSFTTGAGSRPMYKFGSIDNNYSDIFLGYNTGEGSSYNVSGTLSKNFISDRVVVRNQVSYSYGDSDVLIDATSSQNSSQWENLETVNGSNKPVVSTSDFSAGHRVIANSTFEYKWTDNVKTRIGLFYEGANGQPFSYTYANSSNLLGDTGGYASALMYVPSSESEANLVDTGDLTASEQYALLSAYIEGDDYLRSRKGTFAERNADRSDWTHIIDLKVAQEFGINFGDKVHKFEVTCDIFNFTNLLNKDWGVRTYTNYNQVTLLEFEGYAADNTTPQFSFDPESTDTKNLIDNSGFQSSRWQMQVGLRYSF